MVRRIPERMCVVCRQVKPKRALVRLVRTVEDHVVVDTTGKLSGRGAYLCHDPSCWATALKGTRLEAALKTKIPASERQKLAAAGEAIARTAGPSLSGSPA